MHDLTEKWHTDVETGSNMLDENEDEHSLQFAGDDRFVDFNLR